MPRTKRSKSGHKGDPAENVPEAPMHIEPARYPYTLCQQMPGRRARINPSCWKELAAWLLSQKRPHLTAAMASTAGLKGGDLLRAEQRIKYSEHACAVIDDLIRRVDETVPAHVLEGSLVLITSGDVPCSTRVRNYKGHATSRYLEQPERE